LCYGGNQAHPQISNPNERSIHPRVSEPFGRPGNQSKSRPRFRPENDSRDSNLSVVTPVSLFRPPTFELLIPGDYRLRAAGGDDNNETTTMAIAAAAALLPFFGTRSVLCPATRAARLVGEGRVVLMIKIFLTSYVVSTSFS